MIRINARMLMIMLMRVWASRPMQLGPTCPISFWTEKVKNPVKIRSEGIYLNLSIGH